jgi:hypothetical protein
MKRDNLAKSLLAVYFSSFISKARVVLLPEDGAKRLPSLLLMLLFTVFAFVILVVSIVLMATESVLSAVLPQAKPVKKATWQDLLRGDRLSPSQLSQTKERGLN